MKAIDAGWGAMISLLALFVGQQSARAEDGFSGRTLYDISTINSFCSEAQRTVTGTDVEVRTIVHTSWAGFVESDAEPYSVVGGSVELTYEPPEAPERPLLSAQYIAYRSRGFKGTGAYPRVISCKMKSAEYLNRTTPELVATDRSCRTVNEALLSEVMGSLSEAERRRLRWTPVLEDDVVVSSGPDWTAGFPDEPYPVLYRAESEGPLRIRSLTLLVSPHPDEVPAPPPYFNFIAFCNATGGNEGFLGSACEPRKWGVRYCHHPAPQYLRRALTRRVPVPTCTTASADPRVCPDGP